MTTTRTPAAYRFRPIDPQPGALPMPNQTDKILLRFFRGGCSAGLGMKVLKALVRQLGGEFRMASNSSGRGACVTVVWPGEE